MAFLDQVRSDTLKEIEAARSRWPLDELKRRARGAPPLRSFAGALRSGFGLIAEIKRRSPSGGPMRSENFAAAPAAYARSPSVKAVSVLTNSTHFGMDIADLERVKRSVPQPILRKDFILDEYQIFQARAFGADAILLMANLLEAEAMRRLFASATEVGLDVLCEVHSEAELEKLPHGVKICGVNSRNFRAADQWWGAGAQAGVAPQRQPTAADPTVELQTFGLIRQLPAEVIKVAESGVGPGQVAELARMGYDAVLVGTSLLKSPGGLEPILQEFERACLGVSKARP